MSEADDMMPDVFAVHAGRIRGADQCADRGAGDRHGFHAHVVERFDHRDMRKPARAAAAECQREGFHSR